MQPEIQEILGVLQAPQHQQFQATWSEFLFNIDEARRLQSIPSSDAQAVLNAAPQWLGGGWTTTRASRVLYSLTGVPLVTTAFSQYRSAWVYALALFWNIQLDLADLPDRAAEAAFQLVQAMQGEQLDTGVSLLPSPSVLPDSTLEGMDEDGGSDAEEEEVEAPTVLPWDTPVVEMPTMLQTIWKQVLEGNRKTDFKSMLDKVPLFKHIPSKANSNNHLRDGTKYWDRTCKTWEQRSLHTCRLLAFANSGKASRTRTKTGSCQSRSPAPSTLSSGD